MLIPILTIALALFILMSLTWLYYVKTNHASYIDVVWALSFLLVATLSFVLFEGYWFRQILVSAMIALWSLRLSTHLWLRLKSTGEDGRYRELKEKWQNNAKTKFYIFYQFQALGTLGLSLPFYFLYSNSDPNISFFEIAGVTLWSIAFLGEIFADRQLKTFKNQPKNKGEVCNVGLWRYSRHPNYFFEWLIWMSYAIMCVEASFGIIAFASPLMMLYFILFVTGIPPTEQQSLLSRGNKYKSYQKQTSAFVPWFPKTKERL